MAGVIGLLIWIVGFAPLLQAINWAVTWINRPPDAVELTFGRKVVKTPIYAIIVLISLLPAWGSLKAIKALWRLFLDRWSEVYPLGYWFSSYNDNNRTAYWDAYLNARKKLVSNNVLILPDLIKALASGKSNKRILSIELLGEIKDESTIDPLLRVLSGDPDAEVRRAVLDHLWSFESSPVVSSLQNAFLNDKDPFVRARAAIELGRMKWKPAMSYLIGLLGDVKFGREAAHVLVALKKDFEFLRTCLAWGGTYEGLSPQITEFIKANYMQGKETQVAYEDVPRKWHINDDMEGAVVEDSPSMLIISIRGVPELSSVVAVGGGRSEVRSKEAVEDWISRRKVADLRLNVGKLLFGYSDLVLVFWSMAAITPWAVAVWGVPIAISMLVYKSMYNSLTETFWATLLARPKGFFMLLGIAAAVVSFMSGFSGWGLIFAWLGLNPLAWPLVILPLVLAI
jgi:hypothetical protein